MHGVSLHWFRKLWSDGLRIVDIWSALRALGSGSAWW